MPSPFPRVGCVVAGLLLAVSPLPTANAHSDPSVPGPDSPFVVARFEGQPSPAPGWRPIAPLGGSRWLLVPSDPGAGADQAPIPGSLGSRVLPIIDLVDPDLRPFLEQAAAGEPTGTMPLLVIPSERSRAARRRVDSIVRATGGTAGLVESDSLVMRADLTASGLATLLRAGAIAWAEPRRAPETDDSFIREFGGANAIETIEGFTGSGVIVEVVDKGLFTDHADLLASDPFVRTLNDGPTDHGTATYGIIFGNGLTQTAARGMMPGQNGLFSSYLAIDDRDAHLAELASDFNGVIQSNSWGSGITRRYTAVSADLDESIRRHGVLVFQSQSNRGDQDSRPEAWAKNAISVGGVNGFGTLDRSDDTWGGSASTGPAIDGRIKPDLVLFNDGILTTSDQGAADHVAFTGTSAATPAVAGHAGVMIEMWRAGLFHGGDPAAVPTRNPSTAMARALLINGAVPYPFGHAADDLGRFRQGWGTPDLLSLWASAPSKWLSDEQDPLRGGEGWARVFEVAPGRDRLAITLSWTEPPAFPLAAHTLVNDLDLRVISPSGVVYHGNHGLHDSVWSTPGGAPDDTNPVENVFIAAPEPGRWQVEVSARSVAVDAWDATPEIDAAFALVATGVDPDSATSLAVRIDGSIPERFDPVRRREFEVVVPDVPLAGTPEIRFLWGTSVGGVPLTPVGPGRYRTAVSGFECLTEYAFRVLIPTDAGVLTLPADPDGWFRAVSVRTETERASESGWVTATTPGLESGSWERGTPSGGGLHLDPPFDADGDGLCWLTDNRAGASGVANGASVLVSPPLTLEGIENPRIAYDLWLASDAAGSGGEDVMRVDYSPSGGQSWIPLAVERSGFRWQRRTHAIDTDATSVLVRFIVDQGSDGSVVEAAIDALTLVGDACPRCGADFDGNGAIDLADIAGFLDGVINFSTAADLNGDEIVDLADVVAFVDDFQNNCGG